MDQSPQTAGFPQPPIQPQVVPELTPPARPRKSRILVRLFILLLLVGLFSSVMLNGLLLTVLGITNGDADGRVQERFFSHNRYGSEKVAIFSIEGTILSGEGFFKQQIDHAKQDIDSGSLKAMVVRVNSPGGTITGSDYMLHHLRKLAADSHIPLVVSMGPMAASGGYYVSMCVGDRPETIFAEPTTWTGSIGVIIPHYNVAELMQKWGIQEDPVATHPLKTMGSIARPMTAVERKIFEELVNQGFVQFKNAIKSGRPVFEKNPAALDKLATGQVYTAQQALENGLIDKIGFVEDAIDRAIALAGLDKENVKVVKYKAEGHLSDILFGQSRMQPSFDLAMLLDAATPRAYYLCTWLPALAGTAK
jgi:protease IV